VTPESVNAEYAPDIATPVVSGSRLVGLFGELHCLDLEGSLRTLWKHADKGIRTHGSCFVSHDRALIATAGGELILLDARANEWRELGRMRVLEDEGAELYSHPALVGSRLYWRGEAELVCVELRPER
jgi:outer membrane protein assembly factor BamB